MSLIQPLDFGNIFVGHLAGTPDLFLYISVLFFAFLAAKLRMTIESTLILTVCWLVILNEFYSYGAIYYLILLIVGLFVFYTFSKIWE